MRPVPEVLFGYYSPSKKPKQFMLLILFQNSLKTGCVLYWWLLIWARPSCTPLSAVWRYFWICKYSFGTRCVFLPFLNDWLMFITTLINLFSYIFQVLHMRKLTVKWKYSMSDSSTTFVTTFLFESALFFVYSSSSLDDSGGRSGIVANPSSRTASPSRCLTLRIRR